MNIIISLEYYYFFPNSPLKCSFLFCFRFSYFFDSIDEAGRGPLAGPVVIAGVVCPYDVDGVVDSKMISKERDREQLYESFMDMCNKSNNNDDNNNNQSSIEWAICVMDAAKIDEINILQATLQGMKAVAQTILGIPPTCQPQSSSLSMGKDEQHFHLRIVDSASIQEEGCYVVCSHNVRIKHQALTRRNSNQPTLDHLPPPPTAATPAQASTADTWYHALIDGNRLPSDMPCPADAVVKGDSKEFSIAAASILAKVTRDRLMRAYHDLYPQYQLQQHKGYPTRQHMDLVKIHGASIIHRRSFAPLKHMSLDVQGNIIVEETP
jgi:ribonuclease HII